VIEVTTGIIEERALRLSASFLHPGGGPFQITMSRQAHSKVVDRYGVSIRNIAKFYSNESIDVSLGPSV